jgi:hypothetical protein
MATACCGSSYAMQRTRYWLGAARTSGDRRPLAGMGTACRVDDTAVSIRLGPHAVTPYFTVSVSHEPAVVGSIIVRTAVTFVAGKPLRRACS